MDDEIVEFGSVNTQNFQSLQNVGSVVQHSEGVSGGALASGCLTNRRGMWLTVRGVGWKSKRRDPQTEGFWWGCFLVRRWHSLLR